MAAKQQAAEDEERRKSGLRGQGLELATREQKEAIAEEGERIKRRGLGGVIKNDNFVPMPFREQCFIQGGIHYLAALRRQPGFDKKNTLPGVDTRRPYGCLMAADIAPFGFINRLTQSPRSSAFFDMPPEILSQLQPTVRLYKIAYNRGEGKKEEVEIPVIFPASTTAGDVKEVLKNKKKRGFGVGLKSFDWSYDGSDPFAIKKSIQAQVKIEAATFSELLKDRGGYRYADLALKTGRDILENPPGCPDRTTNSVVHTGASLDFRLKAVVGYAIPPNLAVSRGMRTVLQGAISDSFVTLELTPTIHEFEFDDSGRLTFTVNYLAYVENFFDDYYYDIFSVGYGNKIEGYLRHVRAKAHAKDTSKKASIEIPAGEGDEPKLLKAEQVKNLQSLLLELFDKNRMYFIKIPWGRLSEAALNATALLPVFKNNGDLANRSDIDEGVGVLQEEASRAANPITKKELEGQINFLKTAQAGLSPGHLYEQVSFFFLYDLVDVILNGIGTLLDEHYPKTLKLVNFTAREDPGGRIIHREKEMLVRMRDNFKKLRILLGPLEIRNPADPTSYMNISIGEIPISTKYFIEWMTAKMLAQERTGMTLSRFLNLFVKNYLRNFLNDNACNGDKTRQTVALYNASISSYSRTEAYDEITEMLIEVGQYPGHRKNPPTHGPDYLSDQTIKAAPGKGVPADPVLNTMGSRVTLGPATKGQALAKNYMVFYAGRTGPPTWMSRGNKTVDDYNGIFHYVLGKDRGLVKNIQLVKTSATGHKEVRFEQEGYDGLLQLREVYNVTVDAFLMPNAYPGTYIFVDPRGFAPDTTGYQYVDPDDPTKKVLIDKYELSRYGIGGYYMVIKTEHHIAEGDFSSKIHAAWVAQLHKDAPPEAGDSGAKIESAPDAANITKCNQRRTEASNQPVAPPSEPLDDVSAPPPGRMGA